MDDISAMIIGLPFAIVFGWLLIRLMAGPIIAYEKIKKIFKIKDDSVIDNILGFITFVIIIVGLSILFPGPQQNPGPILAQSIIKSNQKLIQQK